MDLKKRNLSLDVMRTVAVLLVLMVYASAFLYGYAESALLERNCGLFFEIFSRIGVPLFVMISGALMLNEDKIMSTERILKKAGHMFILLVIWSFGYAFVYQIMFPVLLGNRDVSVSKFIHESIFGHFHLWYLYMLIGLYIITPFLREFVKREKKKLVLLFIGIALIAKFTIPILAGMLPQVEFFISVERFVRMFNLDFFFGFTTYYLAGWYIVYFGISTVWKRCMLYFAAVASLLVNGLFMIKIGDENIGFSNISIFTFIYAAAVFTFISNISFDNIHEKIKKNIVNFSNLCFGIYVVHAVIIDVFHHVFPYSANPLAYILLSYITTVVITYIIALVMSKIPYVKKLVYFN